MALCMVLDIYIESDIEEIKEFVIEEIWKKKKIRPQGKLPSKKESILFDAMWIDIYEPDQIEKEDYMFMYDLKVNTNIFFELYYMVEDCEMELMRFLGEILKKYEGDCVFNYNGVAVLMRREGKIIVDESDTRRTKKLPYELMGLSYDEGEIHENEEEFYW